MFQDPLSGAGSAHNGIPINSVAPSAHDEMCATESEISDGDGTQSCCSRRSYE